MKHWIIIAILSLNLFAQEELQSQEEILPQESPSTQENPIAQEKPSTQEELSIQEKPSIQDRFQTAKVKSPYYASFNVSWTYAYFATPKFTLHSYENINFGVDIGWILGKKNDVLVGLFLDGSVGLQSSDALYGLFAGLKVGGRLFEGRAIPYLKVGASLMHLPVIETSRQFNAYGGVAEVGMAFDIAKGYGINLAYRYNYGKPYAVNLSKMQTHIVTLGFSFYDFGITW